MTYDKFCNEILPSGSGFDCQWDHIKTQKNGAEVFESYYHNMDEHGGYDGFTKMRLTIPKGDLNEFRLTLVGPDRYTDWNARDYLCDTIYNCFTGLAFNWTEED